MTKAAPDKKSLIADMRRVAAQYSGVLTRENYRKAGLHADGMIRHVFGSWASALLAANIVDARTADARASQEWKEEEDKIQDQADARVASSFKAQIAKMNLLKKMIEDAVKAAKPPVIRNAPIAKFKKPFKGVKRGHITLWFNFSDLQLGTFIDAEMMGGLNDHNWDKWQLKLGIWKQIVIAKIQEYLEAGYIVDRVVLACLGDMVEGQDIFKGQVWQVDRNVVDQAIDGANDTAAAFAEIMLSFPELQFHVLEVFGNHGRTGRKGEAPYGCSMDKIYQRMVELQLKNAGVKNCDYRQNECWFYLVNVYGWNHLLMHGDQGMGSLWSSRPTINGLEKGMVRYNQMLQQNIHFVHVGHFHQSWQMQINMSSLLINGSFIGTSPFSATQMVASSPPEQSLHVFAPEQGLMKTEHIYLVDGTTKVQIKPADLG